MTRTTDTLTRPSSVRSVWGLVAAGLWGLMAAPLLLAAAALPVSALPGLLLAGMAWLSLRLGNGLAGRAEHVLLALGTLGALVLAGGMASLDRGTDWMEGASILLRILGAAMLVPTVTTVVLLVRGVMKK
ncbi:MAG: hypothetical protein AB1938_29325 [Myxococcota bacterium]